MKNRKLTKDEIIKILKEHKHEFKRYSVKKIGIFGSYVMGNQKEKSDIDFVIEFENPTIDNYMELVDYLEDLFNRKVDVLTPIGVESIRVERVADEIKRSLVYV